jgi:hypothetical protein
VRAEAAQVVVLAGLAGGRPHLVAGAGQRADGRAADAAAGAEDEHGAVGRGEAVGLQRVDRQSSGEPGGAQSHRLAGREAVGQCDDPVGRHPCVARPAAVVGDAEVVAGDEDLVAGGERVAVAGHDLAGEVDAGHQRRDARDLALGDGGQRVLVVDARPVDADGHLAVAEVVAGQGGDSAVDGVVAPGGQEGGEGVGNGHLEAAG